MTKIRLASALLLALTFLPGTMLAQNSGQYVIVSAQYGTARHQIDVTDRLRDVVSQGRPFRMGNSTFGVDPDPGQKKTLTIVARGPNGQQQTFTYRESSTINGAQFRGPDDRGWNNRNSRDGWGQGWQSGDNGGQYVILNAQYGTANRHIDVTDRLRDVARNYPTFRMGNSTFGVDPDPGVLKTLRIYTRGPNGPRVFEYVEGSTIDGTRFQGWGGGDWGRGPWRGNWNGDRDDDDHGGRVRRTDDRDDDDQGTRARRTDDRDSNGGQYTILSAQYGTANRHIDVTDRLRDVARDYPTFRMGNSTFGVDPVPGQLKELRIYTRGMDGRLRVFRYVEGSTIDGTQFRGWNGGDWGRERWNGRWDGDRDDDR